MVEPHDESALERILAGEPPSSPLVPEFFAWLKAESARLYYANPARSRSIAERAVELATSADDPTCRALALWTRGNALCFVDHYRQAADDLNQARELYWSLGHTEEAARLSVGLVWALAYLGEFEAARSLVAQAQPILAALAPHDSSDKRRLAGLSNNQGILYELQGRYEEALGAYEIKRRIALELGDALQVARTDLNRAFALAALDETREAELVLRGAQEAFVEANEKADAARAGFNLGCLLGQQGRTAECLDAFRAARTLLDSLEGMECQAAEVRIHEIESILRAGETPGDEDLDHLRGARQFFAAHGPRLEEGEAGILLGQAHLARGELDEAAEAIARARDIAHELRPSSLVWRAWHLQGQAAEAGGDLPAAAEAYEQAMLAIERDQAQMHVDAFRTGYLQDKIHVYHDAILLALRQAEPGRALDLVERAHARELVDLMAGTLDRIDLDLAEDPKDAEALRALRRRLVDLLRQARLKHDPDSHWRLDEWTLETETAAQVRQVEADLQSLLRRLEQQNSRHTELMSPVRLPLAHTLRRLPADTLALVYAAAGDELLLFAVDKEGMRSHCRLGPRRDLHEARLAWRAAVERFLWLKAQMGTEYVERHWQPLLAAVQRPARALFETLLAPVAGLLARYPRLLIVPDAELHYLPFAALHDGERYLVESHVLHSAPSLTTLDICQQLDERRARATAAETRSEQAKALILAYSVEGRLPAVLTEARSIAPLLHEARLCCEAEARRAVLFAEGRGYDLVHLATHSRFRADNPLFSSLDLADEPLWVYDVYNLRLQASLVTLSACDTGQGKLRGWEILGLTRGFMAAGAAAVLVSLWAVDDYSTAELMRNFYTCLSNGMSKATALQAAQQSLLRGAPAAWQHPAHWAAFCLIGADGTIGSLRTAT